MDTLFLLAFSVGIFYLAYHNGKRDGSRKAYHVGRRHGRRQRRNR